MTDDNPNPTARADSQERLIGLLDDCDAALSAASYEVVNPDLALACKHRAYQCRQLIAELKQPNNTEVSEPARPPKG